MPDIKPSAINLPNALSMGRLLATPLIGWFIATRQMEAAFYVFVCAGLSDALDGYLARRLKLLTDMGRIIDPLADKALLATTFVMLGLESFLPWWIVALVVGRDFLILLAYGVSNLFGVRIKPEPALLSKFNTALQITLAAVVLLNAGFSLEMAMFIKILLYATATTTVLSWLQYLTLWLVTRGTMDKKIDH